MALSPTRQIKRIISLFNKTLAKVCSCCRNWQKALTCFVTLLSHSITYGLRIALPSQERRTVHIIPYHAVRSDLMQIGIQSASKPVQSMTVLKQPPLPSTRQHPSYGDCLGVKREYCQNCSVLGCVTQCSQSAAHLYEQFLQVQQIGFVTLGPLRCA